VAPPAVGIVEQAIPDARVIGEVIPADAAGPTRYLEARLE
jgi:hypothetical protein